jgi:hypothetical protein
MYGTRIPLVTGRAALDGGRPRVSATAASGAEGLLSRLIGMRLLGMHCRVTRWGLFSRREGFPLMPCWRTSCPPFLSLWASLEAFPWETGLPHKKVWRFTIHMMKTKLESSTEAGYNPPLWTTKQMSLIIRNLHAFCKSIFASRLFVFYSLSFISSTAHFFCHDMDMGCWQALYSPEVLFQGKWRA